jgi:hypothetical protein
VVLACHCPAPLLLLLVVGVLLAVLASYCHDLLLLKLLVVVGVLLAVLASQCPAALLLKLLVGALVAVLACHCPAPLLLVEGVLVAAGEGAHPAPAPSRHRRCSSCQLAESSGR